MNMKKYKIGVGLLFCLIIISLFSVNVFADTKEGYIISKEDAGKTVYNIYSTIGSGSTQFVYSVSTLLQTDLRMGYAKKFSEFAEKGFTDNFEVPTVKVRAYVAELVPITDDEGEVIGYSLTQNWEDIVENLPITKLSKVYSEYLSDKASAGISGKEVEITFKINETDFKIYSSLPYVYVHEVSDDDEESDDDSINYHKYSIEIAKEARSDVLSESAYQSYVATRKVLDDMEYNLKLGIIGASIQYGYNVGSIYSKKQIPLKDAMHETEVHGKNGKYYDYNTGLGINRSFAFYIGPILGKIEINDTNAEVLRKSVDCDTWLTFIEKSGIDITQDDSNVIRINEEFIKFDSNLSETDINDQGYKIADDLVMTMGVRRVQNFKYSKDPKSVLGYNVPLAFPYIFINRGDGSYYLNTVNLRVDRNYYLCLFDNNIYAGNNSNGFNAFEYVTSLASMGIEREDVFLFNTIVHITRNEEGELVSVEREGVVLIGKYDECIMDTTNTSGDYNSKLYATGRKISVAGSYSSALKINEKNASVMYTKSNNNSTIGVYPKAYMFLANEEEQVTAKNNNTAVAEGIVQGEIEVNILSDSVMNTQSKLEEVSKKDSHISLDSEPRYLKMVILFDKVLKNNGTGNVLTENSNPVGDSTSVGNSTSTSENNEKIERYGCYILRNNRYLEDSDLLSWLATDEARALDYVNAKELLNKIQGNFIDNIKPLTYKQWKQMQEIKSELEHDKSMFIVRVFNVMSKIMGVTLIIFGILLVLFYWLDIFSPFSKFSLVQMVSLNRLYPVNDKKLVPSTSDSVKYIDYKDAIVLMAIFIVLGLFFLNSMTMVRFFVDIFNYIMYFLGGKKI